jgi:O-methyltransferase involved in polyketide biosynthesis
VSSDDSTFPWVEAEKDLMAGIDTSIPHSARIWNYWLGGKDNYPVDREEGERYRQVFPGIVDLARAYRHFLARTIRYLAGEEGIRQFLDIGTGLPTVDNTHELAQRIAPTARIVYVDNDPLVLAHARALLTSSPEGVTDYIDADLREPDKILETAAKTLDFSRPIALILSGVLGHVKDDAQPHAIVRSLVARLPQGSFMMLQDGTNTVDELNEAQEGYDDTGAVPYYLRTPEQIEAFFDGLEVVEPGVVPIHAWRPDPAPAETVVEVNTYGGVGRK